MKESPNWLHFLLARHWLPEWMPVLVPVTWLVILILCLGAIIGTRRLSVTNPSRFQSFLELVVSALDNFVRGIVGHEAKTLTPIIGTMFIFILSLNLFGLIPGFMSPTSNPNTTIALALFAFVLVQFMAISRLGPWGYIKHFLGEPIWLAGLMFPIHLIGELARPLSLSIRLFGNIFGEEMVLTVMISIVVSLFGWFLLPVQFPMMVFSVFGSLIQALVFTMLTCIYIAIALSEHEEAH